MQTQIRRRITRRLIWICTVCLQHVLSKLKKNPYQSFAWKSTNPINNMGHSIRLKCAKHDEYHIHQPLQRDITYMIIVKNGLIVCKKNIVAVHLVYLWSQCHRYCLSKHYDRYMCHAHFYSKKLYVAELVTVSHPSSLISTILVCCQNWLSLCS